MTADFLIENADRIHTCRGPAPRCGRQQRETGAIADASLAARGGQIVALGPAAEVKRSITLTPDAMVMAGAGRTVVPGFVDPISANHVFSSITSSSIRAIRKFYMWRRTVMTLRVVSSSQLMEA